MTTATNNQGVRLNVSLSLDFGHLIPRLSTPMSPNLLVLLSVCPFGPRVSTALRPQVARGQILGREQKFRTDRQEK